MSWAWRIPDPCPALRRGGSRSRAPFGVAAQRNVSANCQGQIEIASPADRELFLRSRIVTVMDFEKDLRPQIVTVTDFEKTLLRWIVNVHRF